MSGVKGMKFPNRGKPRKPVEVLARWGDDKRCTTCPVDLSDMHAGWKPESEFNPNSGTRDGRNTNCKACSNAVNKVTREENGGMTKIGRRLHNEDQWLYQCYKMLTHTGIPKGEANARRLLKEVMPADHRCPSCDKLMVSTAGENMGKGLKSTAPRSNAPSLEHVLPKTNPYSSNHNEWDTLQIICWECNNSLGNFRPALQYKATDWRTRELLKLGYNKHMEPMTDEDIIRHRNGRTKPDGDTPVMHDEHVRQFRKELQQRYAEGRI